MSILKKILLIYVLAGFYTQADAQEVLTGLTSNPTFRDYKKIKDEFHSSNSKAANAPLTLPFRDDFSVPTTYPNQTLWASKSVFVNRSYAIDPPSIGVITFDAMDDTGNVYSHISSYPAGADTLTSQSIRLDSLFGSVPAKLTPADSIYLSFFVQAQGNGANPLPGDSLVLQFYNSNLNRWFSIWQIDGVSMDTFVFKYGRPFLQVMIPITQPAYFNADFRFRFYNYARITQPQIPSWRSGLVSNWNIDYVVLDAHRTLYDTAYNDIAIQTYQSSLLKDFQSMPWNQFQAAAASHMEPGLGLKFKNFDDIAGPKNVNQYFYIYDLWNKTVAFEPQPNPNSLNVNSQTVVNFLPNYSAYVYSSAAPKYAEFKVKYQVYTNSPPPDVQRANDSCVFYQRFYNYYAYDDGMPEAGYGLSISDGRLAYQFTLDVPDTLKSIQMFFNQTIGNANQQYFYLTVWDDNNGIPGSVIYEQSGRRPEFEGDLFRYHTYELNEPLAVTGTFYIGWRQTTKDNLNIGYDFNNPQGDKIFYNVTGNWYNVSWQGSLMMRPILGEKANAHVGIEDEKVLDKNQSLHIFPNPASDQVQIQLQGIDNTSDLQIEVWNLQGEIVRRQQFENTISVSDLSSGVYIIQVYNTAKGIRLMQKLIISR